MEESQLVWIASYAWQKNLDYEKTKDCDYLYDKEELIDDVWEYYHEIENIGYKAFCKKYRHYKTY